MFSVQATKGWRDVVEEVDDIVVGDGELLRRAVDPPAPPDGGDNPYVSASGCYLIDIKYDDQGVVLYSREVMYPEVEAALRAIPGVVDIGLLPSVNGLVVPVAGKG